MGEFSHIDESGNARMVDIGAKAPSERVAIAKGAVYMAPATIALIRAGLAKKGDVLGVAQLAGIMGAKRTAELIPLCHPLALSAVDLRLALDADRSAVTIEAICKTTGATGVEMEALSAVAIAALTVYDMVKSVDRGQRIGDIRLVHKSGGKSGTYDAD